MLTPDDPRHGTDHAYTKYGCRCTACCEARRQYAKEVRHRRLERFAREGLPSSAHHGTYSVYVNYGCRCEPCKGAGRARHAARVGHEGILPRRDGQRRVGLSVEVTPEVKKVLTAYAKRKKVGAGAALELIIFEWAEGQPAL